MEVKVQPGPGSGAPAPIQDQDGHRIQKCGERTPKGNGEEGLHDKGGWVWSCLQCVLFCACM